jgi:hypothetical protein
MLQALIVNRLNQVIKNAHPQRFADGIHMIIGGDENDAPFIMSIDGVADQIDPLPSGKKLSSRISWG